MKTLVGLILGVALLVGGGAAQAFDETSLKRLKVTNACKGCVLNGADLEKARLKGASLKRANLERTNLSGADLEGAKLCKTKMPRGEENSGC
jgi:hypothetical protein